jgi:hypothetical protein
MKLSYYITFWVARVWMFFFPSVPCLNFSPARFTGGFLVFGFFVTLPAKLEPGFFGFAALSTN